LVIDVKRRTQAKGVQKRMMKIIFGPKTIKLSRRWGKVHA
jgi:hypothetical protein